MAGLLGWQEYAVSDGSSITRKVKKTDLPLSLSPGILGPPGGPAMQCFRDSQSAPAW